MFKKFVEEQPPCSGYYYVKWEYADKPKKVYLWDCRNICSEDGDPLWNWGHDKSDDPEYIGMDIDEPWMIQWCKVHEFEEVK